MYRWVRVAGVLGLAAAFVLVAVVAAFAIRNELGTPEPPDPLDPDPLATSDISVDESVWEGPTKTQQSQALGTALASPAVTSDLAGRRYRAVYIQFVEFPLKATSPPCVDPCIEVVFYIYDNDSTLTAFVDPLTWTFKGKLAGRGQYPLSQEEKEVAHALAEAHPNVVQKLRGLSHVHGELAVPMYPPDGPCAQRRCATVVFDIADGEGTRKILALVNLSADSVLSLDFRWCKDEGEVVDCGP